MKRWKLKEKALLSFLENFPEYSPIVLQLLWNRNLKIQKDIDEFFNPNYHEDLHDPFLFKDMEKAAERVIRAIEDKEEIFIYGDYDHDGISGSAILYLFLKDFGVNPGIYIPDRQKEGYGLNIDALKEISKKSPKLLITVDCGVSDFEEVKLANELGMEVIILDHHLIPAKLPSAYAIVNAYQKDDKYPFKDLSATGVVFKLVQALIQDEYIKETLENQRKIRVNNPRQSAFSEKWFLDLVAIATVGDIVPLLRENRTLVKYGLVVLAQTRRLGLKVLMKAAGIKPQLQKELDPICKIPITNLDTYTLSHIIVPRLNAAGRMDHANTAFELLITDLEEEAEILAKRLDEKNRDRQNLVDKIMKEVESRLDSESLPLVIFEGKEDWPLGVVGLVASKIVDKYNRPTFIFQEQKDFAKGSGRSIEGFHLMEAMESCSSFLEEFGGHEKAGGFTVKKRNLEKFKDGLNNFAKKVLKKEDLLSKLEIDVELQPEDVNWEFFRELEKFEPFGEENPRPVFLMRNLEITNLRYVGQNGKHLQLKLQPTTYNQQLTKNFKGIYFNIEDGKKDFKIGDRADAVFELIADEWDGLRELRLKIADLKLSEN